MGGRSGAGARTRRVAALGLRACAQAKSVASVCKSRGCRLQRASASLACCARLWQATRATGSGVDAAPYASCRFLVMRPSCLFKLLAISCSSALVSSSRSLTRLLSRSLTRLLPCSLVLSFSPSLCRFLVLSFSLRLPPLVL
eukprot:4052038-Pleurochrysis_carterae.AAC.1